MANIDCLRILRQDASEVIGIIEAMPDRPKEAINWADLECTEAREITNDQGHVYLEVLIEEAAPEAQEFCRLAHKLLCEKGWASVTVVTEW